MLNKKILQTKFCRLLSFYAFLSCSRLSCALFFDVLHLTNAGSVANIATNNLVQMTAAERIRLAVVNQLLKLI